MNRSVKEVYANRDYQLVALRRTVLEEAGIPCIIRNELACRVADAYGGLMACFFPPAEWWPNLCVIDEEDYQEAIEILNPSPAPGIAWNCPRCQQEVPGSINECWNCGEPQPRELPEK